LTRRITQASVVIGACVLTGLVAALTSGPPPGHPPVWPPAGIGLAALLVRGRWLWPAVGAAASLLAVVQLRRSGALPWPELLAGAAAAGLLYAVQAVAGAWLVRRLVGEPLRLVRIRDVLAFLLVAGPLHTAVASTGGSAVYCGLGVAGWSAWPGAWLGWWCGDAAGGLAFAPVTLALVAPPREVWRSRVATVAVPLTVAAGLVILAAGLEGRAGAPAWAAGGGLMLAALAALLLRLTGQVAAATEEAGREAAARRLAEAALREREARPAGGERSEEGRRLEALGVMTGGVVHDFNNLLTGILGNASLAREQLPPGSGLHEYLRPIEKAAEHAAQLCQQVLGFVGRGGPHRVSVDLNRLIEDAGDLVRQSVPRHARVQTELAPGLPPVEADPAQLRQVLLNLVQNAAEALGPQGGAVTVRTGGGAGPAEAAGPGRWVGEPPTGPHAWLEVADTGAGMDEATLARVFDPLFTTKFTGRGLGLAAVRGAVLLHRGAARVVSEPGKGTAFRVYLPAAARPVGVDELTPWPPPIAGGPGRAALVADDDPTVRRLAVVALQSLGFAVAEAVGGPEAVDRVRADPGRFALVLLDLGLVGPGGSDVLADLRALRPDLPVVLTSGHPEPADLPYGPTLQFLPKPFRPVDLKACVRRVTGTTPDPTPR
jgi:signal transduction histidine kinase/CheY-like chemotaxis protein